MSSRSKKLFLFRLILAIFLLGSVATSHAARYRWNVKASGYWTDQANWYNLDTRQEGDGFPDAPGDQAGFVSVITSDCDIIIPDGVAITVGRIVIDDENAYLIVAEGSGSLVFDAGGGNATLEVNGSFGNGSHGIQCPVTLRSSLTITKSALGSFGISGGINGFIAGVQSLTLTAPGAGNISLPEIGANTRLGGVNLSAGMGTLTLTGSLILTAPNGGAGTTGNVTFGSDLVLTSSLTVDTDGGAVNWAGTGVSANVPGRDLVINTTPVTANTAGGAVSLGAFNSVPGGFFVNDVALTTTGTGVGAAGTLTLTGSISLDDDGAGDVASLSLSGGGSIVLVASVTLDTEQGAGAAGSVLFGASAINATSAGVETLAIHVADSVAGGGTDGTVAFGNVGVGTRLGALSVTADTGTIVANGASVLTAPNGGAGTTGNVTFGSDLVLTSSLTVDTDGGAVNWAGTRVSASAAGRDLVINTTPVTANTAGGAVSLGAFNSVPGGFFVNDVAVTTKATGVGAAGTLTLNGSIFVDDDGAGDVATLSLSGVGSVLLGASVTLDTEQGAGAAGSVLLGSVAINATTPGVETLSINVADSVAGGGTDGSVSFVDVGLGTRLGDLSVTVDTGTISPNGLSILTAPNGGAGTTGNVTFTGSVFLPANLAVQTAGGSFTSVGAVNGNFACAYSLTIDTTTGPVTLGNVGTTGALAALAIHTTGPVVITGTLVTCEPPPRLSIGSSAGNLSFEWPTQPVGYQLVTAPVVPSATWTLVTNVPVLVGDQWRVTLPTLGSNQFFRLRR